jgi:tetratricopeptide (TPR) repeat protein
MSQFCPQCGTKNIDEAQFCKNCGFNMNEAALQAQQEKNKQAEKNHINAAQQKQNTSTNTNKKSEAELEREKIAQELRDKIDKRNKYSDTDGNPTNPWNGFLLLIGIAVVLFITIKACSTSDQEILEGSPYQKSNNMPIQEQAPVVATTPEVQNQDIEYFNKAQALWDEKKGRYKKPEKAIEYLSKAIDNNPKNSTYYNDRAVAFDQINKKQKAIKDYTKSIALNLKDGTVYQNRGYTYWDIEDIHKAKTDANKACSLGQCQLQKDIRKWENNKKNETNVENEVDIERYSEGQCESMYSSDSEEYSKCMKNSY